MKKLVLATAALSIMPAVLADYGDMMGEGHMIGWTGGSYWMSLAGVIFFAIAAFLFSIIFWATHNWLVKGKKR